MRVSSENTALAVAPGASTALTIDVRNTDDVIAGVSANVIGLADELVRSEPRMLPLFPDASGQLRVDLAVPRDYPAGRHAITVELVAHGSSSAPDYLDVDLDVDARPGLRLTARPRIARARRSGRFLLELVNTGNVALDVRMKAVDADRQAEITFTPERRIVEPGTIVPVLMRVKGPRMLVGSEVERSVEVRALARQVVPGQPLWEEPRPQEPTAEELADRWVSSAEPDEVPADDEPVLPPEPESDDELTRSIVVRLKQRPLIGRGLLTIFVLIAILALWAGAFLFGLLKVFVDDPPTKQAPASFFASLPESKGGSGGSGADGIAGAPSADVVPAGALDKSGQMPPGTGGTITGTVVAKSNRQPVGRILVTVYRQGRNKLEPMSSAATQSDGTYSLTGLFPTRYKVKFSRDGFTPVWYPARSGPAAAQWLSVDAQATNAGVDAVVTGAPASISGLVDTGDSGTTAITKVTARPLLGASTGKIAASARTDARGKYTLRNLPAPGSYELTFDTPGYQPSTLTETVSGGDRRIEPTVTVGANQGSIVGRVTSGGQPLGGATVSTTVNGREISVGTPTTGDVGRFVISGLPTPATYVVTITSPDFGSRTKIVAMRAGQPTASLPVALSAGDGTLSGRVVDSDDNPIGAATVTVAGTGSAALTTSTLTSAGDKGRFVLNGIRGRTVTVTASAANYVSTTVTIDLSTWTPNDKIPLADAFGTLSGRVVSALGPAAGASVTATNGQKTYTTTADSLRGFYRLSGLPPGYYSVTATKPGYLQRTVLVDVDAGQTSSADVLYLRKPE